MTIVVTGVGAVSAYGWGVGSLWSGLCSAKTAIGEFDLFDHSDHRTHVAGQSCAEPESAGRATLDPNGTGSTARDDRTSRTDRFALAAAREAATMAGGLSEIDPTRIGVFFGSSTGGMFEAEAFFRDMVASEESGTPRLEITRVTSQQNNAPGDAVARAFGVAGPVQTVSTACAAGSMAIGSALRALRSGEIDLALAGGADGLCQLTYAGFNSLRAVDARPCRPFRADRGGLSLGEGAGVLILESREHADRRGARYDAVLSGAGASCDAFHMTAPKKDGSGAAEAMAEALRSASWSAQQVDFINAHGTGTTHNDSAEWSAVRSVFEERADHLPTTSTKGCLGHLLGAAGAIEAVATLLCLREGKIHPTPGDGELDPNAAVHLVRELRDAPTARRGISVNLAFGGANAALAFEKCDEGSAAP